MSFDRVSWVEYACKACSLYFWWLKIGQDQNYLPIVNGYCSSFSSIKATKICVSVGFLLLKIMVNQYLNTRWTDRQKKLYTACAWASFLSICYDPNKVLHSFHQFCLSNIYTILTHSYTSISIDIFIPCQERDYSIAFLICELSGLKSETMKFIDATKLGNNKKFLLWYRQKSLFSSFHIG